MTLTVEQARAALTAQRLLSDDGFLKVLKRIEDDATQSAVYADTHEAREQQRQMVLAITRLRAELIYDAELPDAEESVAELARSME